MPSLFFLPMWPLGSNSGRLSGFLFTEASEMWGQEGAPGQPPAPKSKWPLEVAEDAGWWARYAGPCSCRVQVRRPHWLGCPLSGGQAIPPGSFLPSPGTRCSTPPPQNAPPAPTTLPTTGVHLPGWSLGFVTEQLTRSIPLEEKQLEPSYFSLSVAPQALGVFTLNSRPAERIYNLIMEF